MSSIENILGNIKNKSNPTKSPEIKANAGIREIGNTGKLEYGITGILESGKAGKTSKTIQKLTSGNYRKFTMMVRSDLLQKIKALNMNNSHEQGRFIPEYVTLEEIITYYFENHKVS